MITFNIPGFIGAAATKPFDLVLYSFFAGSDSYCFSFSVPPCKFLPVHDDAVSKAS